MFQGGQSFKILDYFYRTYERGVADIDITMACDISIVLSILYTISVFFLN